MAKKIVKGTRKETLVSTTTMFDKPIEVRVVEQDVVDDWNNKVESECHVAAILAADAATAALDAAIDQEGTEPSTYEMLVEQAIASAKSAVSDSMKTLALESLGLEFDEGRQKLVGNYQWNDLVRDHVKTQLDRQIKAYIKKNPVLLSASELEAIRLTVKEQMVTQLKEWVTHVFRDFGGDAAKEAEQDRDHPMRHFYDLRKQVMFDAYGQIRESVSKVFSKQFKKKLASDVMKRLFDKSVTEAGSEA